MFGSEVRGRCDIVGQLVADLCTNLDPNIIGLTDVSAVFDELVTMRKRLDGAIVRMTARYEEAGSWKRSGAKDLEDDLARKTGTSKTAARRTAATSRRLKDRPKTDAALRDGKLSPDQADAVTSGADASPEDEDDLLDSAAKDPLHATRDKAARARAKADRDRDETRRRQFAKRAVKRWTDEDGLYTLLLKTLPEVGAEIDATLKPMIDRAYADARDAGRFEDYDNYAADVVADLLRARRTSAPAAPPCHDTPTDNPGDYECPAERLPERAKNQAVRPDRKVIAFIDVEALNRGAVHDGETCEIAGVGPVSVSAIRSMLSDSALAVVIRDGVDVLNVTHLGRRVTAHQRTALEARGYRCEIEGCGSTHHLDIDHVTGWTLTHDTRLDDLAWLCGRDHDRKTVEGLWLTGPPGRRRFVKPRDNAHPDQARAGPQQFRLAL